MNRLRKRLEHQHELEAARLREEQEKAELANMEREIMDLKQKRSVKFK